MGWADPGGAGKQAEGLEERVMFEDGGAKGEGSTKEMESDNEGKESGIY